MAYILDSNNNTVDVTRSLPPHYRDAIKRRVKQSGIGIKNFVQRMGEIVLPYEEISINRVIPTFAKMNVLTNELNCSLLDILKDAGEDDSIISTEHWEILRMLAGMDPDDLLNINAIAIQISGGWQNDPHILAANVPGVRLDAAYDHIIRFEDSMQYFKLKQPPAELKEVGDLTRRVSVRRKNPNYYHWILARPKRALEFWGMAQETIHLDDVLIIARDYLDISPRWLSGVHIDTNFFGFGAEVEKVYDNWSLLNPPIRDFITFCIQKAYKKQKEA